MNTLSKVNGNDKPLSDRLTKDGPQPGMSWKEWKEKRKEDILKWQEEKAAKKKRKLLTSQNLSVDAESLHTVRDYTISIAVPGSILENAQSPELKTYLAGQVARAAAVFNVNEIIVFSDSALDNLDESDQGLKLHKKNQGCMQFTRILQYLECPQYLRKYYFPIHKDLEYAGLLNPLDVPHHLRVEDVSEYREGIVLNKPVKPGKGSFVYIGLPMTAIIDKILEPNVRVTVQLDKDKASKRHYKGKAVSPSMPYKRNGTYWGYSVRLAKSFSKVFSESQFKEGYDLTVGTSDKGKDVDSLLFPKFKHLLIVFGGLKGLESCLESDESMKAGDVSELFNFYLNTCPNQGSRTIRTEEAILITLAALRPEITRLQNIA